ncbi:lipopolysaccharide heptosyltransferase I [Sulfurimonas sp. SAG-AH-194-C21]|nr:lipopolysaccharide heptosyltransferase I [Sulfurimonas sp. SAG-AH-194-C21]MDF1883594.1 lipopolysaccharide heptosyltransferase I [Sulfurimonas sp. SAG-AH-194-C21]
MNKDIKKIAIVRLSALGDIVNSAVVLQFIKENYPDAQIEWITEEVFSPILELLPQLNAVHTINLKRVKKEKSLQLLKETLQTLKKLNNFDIIIDMQGLIKSALVSRLIGKNTHGFDKSSTRESLATLFYKSTSHISYESNVLKRNAFIVCDALGFKISDEMLLNKQAIFSVSKKYELPKDKKNVAFVIGASWQSKIYPKELIVELCNALKEDAYIIWGSEKEKRSAEWIVDNSKYATLAPSLELTELVAYISAMDLLIGNDTGPTHIAWAQNIASITLLGPTTTRMIYETPKNIGLKSPSDVNILKIDKNDYSIKEIHSEIIITQAKELLYGL